MGHRRSISPLAIALAKEARKFAAHALELQTPYGNCNADLLQVLAFALDPPRRVAWDDIELEIERMRRVRALAQ